MKKCVNVMVGLVAALIFSAGAVSAQGLTTGATTTAVNDGQTASQIDASSSGTIEYEGDYAYYIYEDGAVDLVKYNGSDENVVIPESFEGKMVVTISNEAFYAAANLKQVTIPEGVKYINYQAFKYCSNLTTVNLPTTLETIGTGAFEYCAKLTNLSLPGEPEKGELTGFLGWDSAGNYYLCDKVDFNNSYLAYQIDPSLAGAKMYQHFLTNKCKIVALKDLTRGYMDYNAAAMASLLAQINLQPFDINAYFASSAATPYGETVGQAKIIDQGGNVL